MIDTVYPDLSIVDNTPDLYRIVGALMTIALITAVLMLIVSAAAWALGASAGNYQAAHRARLGLWVSIGTATLAGAGVAWTNFLLRIGAGL